MDASPSNPKRHFSPSSAHNVEKFLYFVFVLHIHIDSTRLFLMVVMGFRDPPIRLVFCLPIAILALAPTARFAFLCLWCRRFSYLPFFPEALTNQHGSDLHRHPQVHLRRSSSCKSTMIQRHEAIKLVPADWSLDGEGMHLPLSHQHSSHHPWIHPRNHPCLLHHPRLLNCNFSTPSPKIAADQKLLSKTVFTFFFL